MYPSGSVAVSESRGRGALSIGPSNTARGVAYARGAASLCELHRGSPISRDRLATASAACEGEVNSNRMKSNNGPSRTGKCLATTVSHGKREPTSRRTLFLPSIQIRTTLAYSSCESSTQFSNFLLARRCCMTISARSMFLWSKNMKSLKPVTYLAIAA